MKRIIDYLKFYAQETPSKVFITEDGGKSLTYQSFWDRVNQRAEEWKGELSSRQACVLRASQTIDYLVDYFACHLLEKVIVPLEHDISEERFLQIQKLVDEQPFPSEASDVLFTTGTTGMPKGVVLSHKALLTDANNLAEGLGFSSDLTFIINGPLNHFGNHSKVLPVVRTGGSIYLMESMKNLDDFYRAIEATTGHVATFLVPASIRMLIQMSAKRLTSYASRIEFIESGAAPITQTDMMRLAELLPNSRLFNTYAGSEVGVVCTYNFNDGNAYTACVGRTFPYSKVELRDSVVVCSGDGLMMGYLGQPLVETQPEVITSDLGRMDEEGRLFLIGRQSDLINVGGLKVSPIEVEEVATELIEGLRDCICIPQPHPIMGYVPKLLVVMNAGCSLDKRAIAKAMRSKLESYKVPVNIEEVDHVERTYNGKINRKFYSVTEV
ncbi:MAG: acyl--CoA ligase [Bacteroidales bacterium]|nr:acyl--CoA ligase [Bacteroidales bacterium]